MIADRTAYDVGYTGTKMATMAPKPALVYGCSQCVSYSVATVCLQERGSRDYDVVVVGHSLGAGTAAILAILLRQEYPSLHCYAFSPPGGLLRYRKLIVFDDWPESKVDHAPVWSVGGVLISLTVAVEPVGA